MAWSSHNNPVAMIGETVRHVQNRDGLFTNLYRRLALKGILLLVHVLPDVRYPQLEKALERCMSWHAAFTTPAPGGSVARATIQ